MLQGAIDYYQCEKVWGSDDWVPQLAAWFARQGVPPEETGRAARGRAASTGRSSTSSPTPGCCARATRSPAGACVEFPGHADGHICLLKDGVLIAGDHLLPRITPAVGLYPDSRPDPLGDFMASLERVAELAPRLALPGHGEPIDDPAGRAREIVAAPPRAARRDRGGARDRAARAGTSSRACSSPATCGAAQRRFAVAETLSHAERLVVEGRAARGGDDGRVTYTRP